MVFRSRKVALARTLSVKTPHGGLAPHYEPAGTHELAVLAIGIYASPSFVSGRGTDW